jgi:hypothetical protein
MTSAVLLLCSALAAPASNPLAAELDAVARTASVMVDGDEVSRIPTARSAAALLKKDPRDPWAASDNYDVNHEPFIATKKTLIRLSRLCSSPCSINLWMPIPAKPPRIQIVIRNAEEMSQFWVWGALHQDMFPEMKHVLDTGSRLAVQRRPGMISVLAPVRNSLGDIVALVEVVSQLKPDPQENVQ